MELCDQTPQRPLLLYAEVADELRKRGITRSSNNPTGELAEYLFCKAFQWSRADNSHANIDAVGPDDLRYPIKGRRITRFNNSRQLSAIRDMAGSHFDYLACVLFREDYTIFRAALIPHAVALAHATFVQRTNSHRLVLGDDIWRAAGVREVTSELQAVTF